MKQLNIIIVVLLLTVSSTVAMPMIDHIEVVEVEDGNGMQSVRAYQDHENPCLWYFLPSSYVMRKSDFNHSFFDINDGISIYQFVFEPAAANETSLQKLERSIQ